jgi:hypothetical protein
VCPTVCAGCCSIRSCRRFSGRISSCVVLPRRVLCVVLPRRVLCCLLLHLPISTRRILVQPIPYNPQLRCICASYWLERALFLVSCRIQYCLASSRLVVLVLSDLPLSCLVLSRLVLSCLVVYGYETWAWLGDPGPYSRWPTRTTPLASIYWSVVVSRQVPLAPDCRGAWRLVSRPLGVVRASRETRALAPLISALIYHLRPPISDIKDGLEGGSKGPRGRPCGPQEPRFGAPEIGPDIPYPTSDILYNGWFGGSFQGLSGSSMCATRTALWKR